MPEISPEVLGFMYNFLPFLLMAVVFYFLFYRPQSKDQKKRSDMLANLKKGTKIVTIGGIYGEIVSLNDKTITLKIADKVEIVISRSAVSQLQFPKDEKHS